MAEEGVEVKEEVGVMYLLRQNHDFQFFSPFTTRGEKASTVAAKEFRRNAKEEKSICLRFQLSL